MASIRDPISYFSPVMSKKYGEREQSVLHVKYSGVSPLATSVASRSEWAASRLTLNRGPPGTAM
jgi:hypothetical protein